MSVDERGRRLAGGKNRMVEAVCEEFLVGPDAKGCGVFEGGQEFSPRFVARCAMADQLGDHGIVIGRYFTAGFECMLDADTARHVPQRHRPALRHEAPGDVLGAETHLDRVAVQADIVLRERQRFAAGDTQLQFDQVEPGDRFRHRVFDLETRVHFHEMKLAAGVEQELDGAGALVADRLDRRHRRRSHALAQRRADCRGRGFLDQLSGAAAAPSSRVRRDEWPGRGGRRRSGSRCGAARRWPVRRCTVRIAEGALRFRPCAPQRREKLPGAGDQAHAAPAATGGGLDHDRVADRVRRRLQCGLALVGALIARNARDARFAHQFLGAGLVAHRPDGLRRGPDEDQAGVATRPGKAVVLGEKAIAGVHGVGAADRGGFDDRGDVQVGLRRQGLADMDRLIGFANMTCVLVGARR